MDLEGNNISVVLWVLTGRRSLAVAFLLHEEELREEMVNSKFFVNIWVVMKKTALFESMFEEFEVER